LAPKRCLKSFCERPIQVVAGMFRDYSFVRFIVVGVLNTAFGYSLFVLALLIMPTPSQALVASTILAVLFNFKTIGGIVFGMHDMRLLARFIGVYVVVFVYNDIGLNALDAVGVGAFSAGLILTPGAAVGSYVLNRRFVFRSQAGQESLV
jgi:putative flippase GtrA